MGSAAAVLLARHDDIELLVLDVDLTRAEKIVGHIGRGEAREVDISGGSLADDLRDSGARTVAACIPYRLNVPVMEAALEAGCHYADLGGLFHTTLEQLELDVRFRQASLSAVLGIGSAPGLTNLLAKRGADRLDEAHSIDLLDGAVEPGGGFALPYSAETVLDEFTMPAMVFEDGTMREAPAASGAIRGKQVHAANPNLGIDPIVAAAGCITALQTVRSRRIDPNEAMVLTIGSIHGGNRANIIPGEVILHCVRWYLRYPIAYLHMSEMNHGASLLTRCIARRDGQRAVGLEMGLVGIEVCSLRGIGEPP